MWAGATGLGPVQDQAGLPSCGCAQTSPGRLGALGHGSCPGICAPEKETGGSVADPIRLHLSAARLLWSHIFYQTSFHPRREWTLPSGLAPLYPLHPALSSRRGTIQTGPHFLLPILQMRKIRPKWRQKLEILCRVLDNSDLMTALPVTGTLSNLL